MTISAINVFARNSMLDHLKEQNVLQKAELFLADEHLNARNI